MSTDTRPSTRTLQDLGKVSYEQRPSTSNQVAGVILSILLFGGGLTLIGFIIREVINANGRLPLYVEQGMSWFAAILGGAIGIGLAVGGAFLFRWVWSMFSFRLFVCADGFYYIEQGQTFVFAWDEIQLVEETVLHERLPLVKGPAKHLMPTKTSRHYRVVRCDGVEFGFNGNTIQHTSLLAGPLAAGVKRCGAAWHSKEETG